MVLVHHGHHSLVVLHHLVAVQLALIEPARHAVLPTLVYARARPGEKLFLIEIAILGSTIVLHAHPWQHVVLNMLLIPELVVVGAQVVINVVIVSLLHLLLGNHVFLVLPVLGARLAIILPVLACNWLRSHAQTSTITHTNSF